jgi:hypothetical protein
VAQGHGPSLVAAMRMIPLSSSNLQSCGYDENLRELKITFKNGATYAYSDVDPEVFEDLQRAPSAGQYFNEEIKDSYPTRKSHA